MTVAKARPENERNELCRRGSHTFSFVSNSEIQTLERTVSSAPPTTLNLGSQNASCPSSNTNLSPADPHSVVGWTLLSLGTHTVQGRAVKNEKQVKIYQDRLLLSWASSPPLSFSHLQITTSVWTSGAALIQSPIRAHRTLHRSLTTSSRAALRSSLTSLTGKSRPE